MFPNRTEAGRQLAAKLKDQAQQPDALVLGISRAGLAVAHEVARRLRLPLDVFVVRKLAAGDHKLLTLGAVASGGIRVLDHELIDASGLSTSDIAAIERREREEVRRLEAFYRDDRDPLQLRDRTLILIDDGISSGSTMLAAIACARSRQPRRIIAASPVCAARACERIQREADELICLQTPPAYHGAPQGYDDFRPVSAEAVHELLSQYSEVL